MNSREECQLHDEERRFFINAKNTVFVVYQQFGPDVFNLYTVKDGEISRPGRYKIKTDVLSLPSYDTSDLKEVLVLPKEIHELLCQTGDDCTDGFKSIPYEEYVSYRTEIYEVIDGRGLKKIGEDYTYNEKEEAKTRDAIKAREPNEGDLILVIALPDMRGQQIAYLYHMRKGETAIRPFDMMNDGDIPGFRNEVLEMFSTDNNEGVEGYLRMMQKIHGEDFLLTLKEVNPLPEYLEGKNIILAYEFEHWLSPSPEVPNEGDTLLLLPVDNDDLHCYFHYLKKGETSVRPFSVEEHITYGGREEFLVWLKSGDYEKCDRRSFGGKFKLILKEVPLPTHLHAGVLAAYEYVQPE